MNPEGLSSPDFQFDFLLMIYVRISHISGTPQPGGNRGLLYAAIARCTYMSRPIDDIMQGKKMINVKN